MIILSGTTDSLELVTAYAGTIHYTVSYADITATVFTPGAGQGAITTAATTTLAAAPGASTNRQIKLLTVSNVDTNSQTVTLQKTVSGTARIILNAIVLASGETLQYLDGQGFSVLDPFARSKEASTATIGNTPGVNTPYYVVDPEARYLMKMMIQEMRLLNLQTALAFNLNNDIDALRDAAAPNLFQ